MSEEKERLVGDLRVGESAFISTGALIRHGERFAIGLEEPIYHRVRGAFTVQIRRSEQGYEINKWTIDVNEVWEFTPFGGVDDDGRNRMIAKTFDQLGELSNEFAFCVLS